MSPYRETCKNYFARDLFQAESLDAHKSLSEKEKCTYVDSIYEHKIRSSVLNSNSDSDIHHGFIESESTNSKLNDKSRTRFIFHEFRNVGGIHCRVERSFK